MGGRPSWLVAVAGAAVVAGAVVDATAEPAPPRPLQDIRCTHRDDRPDLGSPVHKQRGGEGGLRHRLKNGTRVEVLRSVEGWHRVRYVDPGPPVRSEPLRFSGWIRASHLRECPALPVKAGAKVPSPAPASPGEDAQDCPPGPDGFYRPCLPTDPESLAEQRRAFEHIECLGTRCPLKVCWWKAKRLGHGALDWDATRRALRGCDVVGLGEVMTPSAAGELASHMPRGWKAVTSEKSVGRSAHREHYAVIYSGGALDEVEGGVRGFFDDTGDVFEREPWAVTLKRRGFDFTAVLFHATRGKSTVARVQELQHARDAFTWFQDQDAEENDIVLMGDFNRAPEQAGWGPLLALGMKLLVAGGGTTVTAGGTRAKLYDQIIIDPEHTTEWTGKAGVVDAPGVGLRDYRKRVGDHLPVWATFEDWGRDDD